MEKLLVFIPAYNCEKQVPRVLSQLLDARVAPWVGECIVVNNRGSRAGLAPPPSRCTGAAAAQR